MNIGIKLRSIPEIAKKESYFVGRGGLTSFVIVNYCSEEIGDPDNRVTTIF
jgi:hypothetical protein